MNIVIMMAGSSVELQEKGIKYPKFLVEINGNTMIEVVANSLQSLITEADNVIFIIKKSDNDKFYLGNIIRLVLPNAHIVTIEEDTAGAAITSLLAIEYIDKKSPLLLINGDQIIDHNLHDIVKEFDNKDVDGGVIVFKSVHPRWSFVKIDDDNKVIEAAEKKPISDNATAGFYFYKNPAEYIKCAKRMILKDSHIDGKFYICPVFNEMILDHKKITTFEIKAEKYHSFMSLEQIKHFETIYRGDLIHKEISGL